MVAFFRASSPQELEARGTCGAIAQCIWFLGPRGHDSLNSTLGSLMDCDDLCVAVRTGYLNVICHDRFSPESVISRIQVHESESQIFCIRLFSERNACRQEPIITSRNGINADFSREGRRSLWSWTSIQRPGR